MSCNSEEASLYFAPGGRYSFLRKHLLLNLHCGHCNHDGENFDAFLLNKKTNIPAGG